MRGSRLAIPILLTVGCVPPPYLQIGSPDLTAGERPPPSRVYVGRRVVLVSDQIGSPVKGENSQILASLWVFPPAAVLEGTGEVRTFARGKVVDVGAEMHSMKDHPHLEGLLEVIARQDPRSVDQLELKLRLCVAKDCEDLAVTIPPAPRASRSQPWRSGL
jgi:hypothetical protein